MKPVYAEASIPANVLREAARLCDVARLAAPNDATQGAFAFADKLRLAAGGERVNWDDVV